MHSVLPQVDASLRVLRGEPLAGRHADGAARDVKPAQRKEWSGGNGADVVLDMVGGDYFAKHLKVLARDGRLVHIATVAGNQGELDLRTVMEKRLIITGSTLRSRSVEEKRILRDGVERNLWPLVQEGKIRPVLDSVFPLPQAATAHKRMQSSMHMGKIVLQSG